MAYPANIDSFPTVANDTVSMNTHRDLENSQSTAIVAIETELGPDVSGSFASLAERLAAGGGGGNEFLGDWQAGVTYQDGDVVIYNGLPYMAVDPSTGTAPEAWAVEGAGIQGPVGPAGPQGPQGIQGPTGAASTVPGPQGDPGTPGTAGAPGEKWFTGSGAPAGATGIVGDWYIDSVTGDYYEKTGASTWTSRGNLKGPQGNQGPTGNTGNTGNTGAAGEKWFSGTGAPAGGLAGTVVGDWYLDTATADVYEKTGASAWTLRANIKGAQGNVGNTGPAGVAGPWRMGQTWAIDGEIVAGTMPVIFIPLAGTQTCTLVGVRAKIGAGTSITAQMQRNGSNLGSAITVTTTAALTAFSQAFSDGDQLGLVLSAPVGTPIDLSLTAILQHQA